MDKNKHEFRNNYQNVTIEIDSDDENESDELLHIPGLSIPIKFGVKYNLSHVEFEVSDIYELCDLTVESMEILSGHLNMKAYGSMKNWEYVACSYGMSSDSIMMMQRDYNPFELLCKKFPRKNLKEFIGLLQTMNRIDTLYSLKKIFDASLLCKTDKFGENTEHSCTVSSATSLKPPFVRPARRNVPSTFHIPDEFLLVVHYETTLQEQNEFKHLMKNLRHNQKRDNPIPIIDTNEHLCEENIVSSSQSLFNKAQHVVVCFSPSFVNIHEIESSTEMIISINLNLIRMMHVEFFGQNCLNKRFRPVIFEKLSKVVLPIGWATSTIQYKFPSNGKTLLKRLFNTDRS